MISPWKKHNCAVSNFQILNLRNSNTYYISFIATNKTDWRPSACEATEPKLRFEEREEALKKFQ